MSLVTAPIKDFAHGIYDGPHATPKEATEGHIFLGIKNVTPEGRLDFSQIKYVSEEEFPKWTKRVTPQAGDVVFSYEATLHRYAVIPGGFDGCLGRRMGLVRPDTTKLLPRYLHYYFLSPVWQRYLETKVITGVTVNRLPIKDFPDFLITVPSIDEQARIVDVLSSYDDLIENNRRRIQLLEESARLLYQEWFVHLRFPGHEHVMLSDGLPLGWEQKPLTDIAKVNEKSLKKGFQERIEYIDISSVSTHAINETTWYEFADAPGRARRVLQHGDILWSCVRPNRRSHALVIEPHDRLIASTGFAVITAKTVSPYFLYQALTTNDYVGYLTNNAGGAAYPAVTGKVFEKSTITVPPQNLISEYDKITQDIYRQMWGLKQHSEKLAQARDLLLPRLMNGELTP